MAIPQFPDLSGSEYDPSWARQLAERDIPRVPAVHQQAPDFNAGPIHLNGGALDSAALAVFRALQNSHMQGGNFGTGLATGLASGLSGARVGQMQARSAANAAEDKRVAADDIARRQQAASYGRSLARHRWDMQRDAAKQKPGSDLVDVTPEVRAEAAKNGIYIHPALTKVNRSQLVRQVQSDIVGDRMAEQHKQAVSDAGELLDGVMAGDLSPNPSDLFSSRDPEVRKQFNILAKQRGFNLLAAQRTHQGYKTFYNTLNGRLQLAVRQSVSNAQGGLDLLSDLNKQMASSIPRNSQFTVMNRAALTAAKQGVFGKEARDLAIQMDQQIGNLISELANVYQGGGVPTDEARKQAEANFYGKYAGERSLEKNIELAKRDVGIRANAILTTGPMTPNTPSGGYPVPQPPPAPGQAPPSVNDAPAPAAPAPPLGGLFGAIKSQVEQARGGKKK
jgi:hypothetical protein